VILEYWSIGNPNVFLDTLTKHFRVFVTSLMRAHSATLPLTDSLPTTTTGYHML